MEYLVENLSKDLISKYPVKDLLILDYCYKRKDSIPEDYFSDFVSKVLNKKVNNSSRTVSIDETDINYCLFLESYRSLLSNNAKGLIKHAKTSKDFKAIVAIDVLSKKVNANKLPNSNNLDSKVFQLAEVYNEVKFEKEVKKEYDKLRNYSLKVHSELNKPLDENLVKKIGDIKKELNKKSDVCSKFPDNKFIPKIQGTIRELNNSIDNKLRNYMDNIDQRYSKIKSIFEDCVWDSEKRVNKLIGLRAELEETKNQYNALLNNKGSQLCNSLDSKIKKTIDNYNNIRRIKEEFRSIKTEISGYYNEIKSVFHEDIEVSSVRKINRIYSRLKRLSNNSFPDFVPSDWLEDYYSGIEKAMSFVKQKYSKRVKYLANKSSKYRVKVDKSIFSWQTERSAKKLEKYDTELLAWSKCNVI